MKKLMIAAAAVALVGGAFATEYVYDYSASLKTTKGKSGTQKTTYTVNCGLNEEGEYWWDEIVGEYTTADEAKKAVNKLSNEEKRIFAIDELGFDEETLTTKFNEQEYYNGKWRWCFSFKYTVTETDCYRVAGSIKVSDTVYVDECCGGTWEFEDDTEINTALFYRFGGLTAPKATKVELVATWDREGFFHDNGEEFAIAGQGTWTEKLAKNQINQTVAGIKNISGNIVGILENPGCKDCCNYPVDARCFECDGTALSAYEEVDPGYIVSDAKGTAAYGTWSIKFNSKKSFK